MKITITQRTKYPGQLGPKLFLCCGALLAAPFTGGISLLAFPIGFLALGAAKCDARRNFQRTHPSSESDAARLLMTAIRNGQKRGYVEHEASSDGDDFIPIVREYSYEIKD